MQLSNLYESGRIFEANKEMLRLYENKIPVDENISRKIRLEYKFIVDMEDIYKQIAVDSVGPPHHMQNRIVMGRMSNKVSNKDTVSYTKFECRYDADIVDIIAVLKYGTYYESWIPWIKESEEFGNACRNKNARYGSLRIRTSESYIAQIICKNTNLLTTDFNWWVHTSDRDVYVSIREQNTSTDDNANFFGDCLIRLTHESSGYVQLSIICKHKSNEWYMNRVIKQKYIEHIANKTVGDLLSIAAKIGLHDKTYNNIIQTASQDEYLQTLRKRYPRQV